MKKYQITASFAAASIILLTAFQKKPVEINTEPVKVSIAEATAIKGEKGQRPVKVMIYLSKATTEPVSVKFRTENGSAKAGVDYVASSGSVTFQPGEVAKWITVLIIGQVAADPDEDASANNVANFIIMISEATGAIIDMARAYISILPLIPAGIGSNQAVYEVIISYRGFTSFHGTAGECGIRPDGIVVLSGYLIGSENVGPDDDIMYTGNLEMIIDIDICSADRPPGSSEDKLCGISVNGSGKVYTELEIYYGSDATGNFDGRGGYIKIEDKTGNFRRVVTGDCGSQVDEEWTMVPNKSISSVFNGKELPMLKTRTLRKGTYSETDPDGNITVIEVLRKIR